MLSHTQLHFTKTPVTTTFAFVYLDFLNSAPMTGGGYSARTHGIGYQSSDGSHWFNGSVSVKDQTANGDCLRIMSLL